MSRWENKYVIGLTGNIAVGKSVVRQMLQHLGAYTIDADGLAHQAMAPGAPAYKPVINMFGRFVVDDDGHINRAQLGSIVFAVPEAMARLEAISHPVVNQAIRALVSRARQRVVVIEAIKLLEGNLADSVDVIWVVNASPETQLRRLVEKRKLPDAEARKRILAQRAQADKLAQADVVIMNDGNVEETWKQVLSAWNAIPRGVRGATGRLGGTGRLSTPAQQPAPRPKSQTSTLEPIPRQPTQTAPTSADPRYFDPKTEIVIRRGMPGNAEAIAKFISQVTGNQVGRMDIMLAFGQKSYHIAYGKNDQIIGLIGWTVENLITRIDEFSIVPNVPYEEVIRELVVAIEEASRELQSEVSFIVLPADTPPVVIQSFVKNGYQYLKLNEVKFPAWREAAHEMIADSNGRALMKQLRADRVMKPI